MLALLIYFSVSLLITIYVYMCVCNVLLVLVNVLLCCLYVLCCDAIDASLLHQLMSHGWMHTDTHKDLGLGGLYN